MPDGGSGIDPTFTLPDLLAETWGTTPEKVSAVFDRFAGRPDGDAALRRLEVVRRSHLLGYSALGRPGWRCRGLPHRHPHPLRGVPRGPAAGGVGMRVPTYENAEHTRAWQQGFGAFVARGKDGDPRAPYDGRTAKAKAWYAGWKAAAEQAAGKPYQPAAEQAGKGAA